MKVEPQSIFPGRSGRPARRVARQYSPLQTPAELASSCLSSRPLKRAGSKWQRSARAAEKTVEAWRFLVLALFLLLDPPQCFPLGGASSELTARRPDIFCG